VKIVHGSRQELTASYIMIMMFLLGTVVCFQHRLDASILDANKFPSFDRLAYNNIQQHVFKPHISFNDVDR
jgi:hypothetical protein